MKRATILAVGITAALLVALILAPAAMAGAGGGVAGFSGGGGGGGGGGGRGFELYILIRILIDIAILGHGLGLLFLVALGLLFWFWRFGLPKLRDAAEARAQAGRASSRRTRRRERRVELAAAEAADENPAFAPQEVRTAAAQLFTEVQLAWGADDRIRLRGLVAPELLREWERRLDEFQRQGWRNRVEPLGPPTVEYVGLVRGHEDRVVVRIEARMRDFVVDAFGRRIKRRGQFTETVRLREYWTLQRRDDHWVLASVEQGAEGEHALRDKIVQTSWADETALRDEAIVEQAAAEAVPQGVSVAEVADLQFSGSAHAAANDLSLADGRFAPDVLEVAARRAVDAWAEAVDGSDRRLRMMAEPAALAELLYAGDHSGRSRLVVRGPEVKQIRIVGLEAATDPPTMTVELDIRGRRYVQDRDTTAILAGSPNRQSEFTERWTFALTGDPSQPWRISDVRAPAAA